MKTLIIILSFVSLGLNAQTQREQFEKACLEDTIWIDINKNPYEYYGNAVNDMNKLKAEGHIKTCEIHQSPIGYWISCKVVRNPEYSNYGFWLKHGKLSTRINKKALIFVD